MNVGQRPACRLGSPAACLRLGTRVRPARPPRCRAHLRFHCKRRVPMARLACLGMLTVLLVAAPALGQVPSDAKAPSSDDYVLVDATDLSSAVLMPEFEWPQGTIIDSQESSSSCSGGNERLRGFEP